MIPISYFCSFHTFHVRLHTLVIAHRGGVSIDQVCSGTTIQFDILVAMNYVSLMPQRNGWREYLVALPWIGWYPAATYPLPSVLDGRDAWYRVRCFFWEFQGANAACTRAHGDGTKTSYLVVTVI